MKYIRLIILSVCVLFLKTQIYLAGENSKGEIPKISNSVLFNTPQADSIMSRLQIFPKDNPWNTDISGNPVHLNSDKMIQSYGPNTKLAYNLDMCYVIVPENQPKINVKLVDYPDESDKGPYPVPNNATIEGYPMSGGDLDTIQTTGEGDRHLLIVDPYAMKLYEFWQTRRIGSSWQASNEATFDLTTNKTRPKGWTSSDAAGLPLTPATIRFDDVASGIVAHAMRITFKTTRKAYFYPATHSASRTSDDKYAAMGERLRLKANFDVDSFSPHPKAILLGMKKYGIFVADNGGNWRISVCPDSRIEDLNELSRVKGSDFEFIKPVSENAAPFPPKNIEGIASTSAAPVVSTTVASPAKADTTESTVSSAGAEQEVVAKAIPQITLKDGYKNIKLGMSKDYVYSAVMDEDALKDYYDRGIKHNITVGDFKATLTFNYDNNNILYNITITFADVADDEISDNIEKEVDYMYDVLKSKYVTPVISRPKYMQSKISKYSFRANSTVTVWGFENDNVLRTISLNADDARYCVIVSITDKDLEMNMLKEEKNKGDKKKDEDKQGF